MLNGLSTDKELLAIRHAHERKSEAALIAMLHEAAAGLPSVILCRAIPQLFETRTNDTDAMTECSNKIGRMAHEEARK